MQKILSIDLIRKADTATIETEPIASIDLMERASVKCFEWINKCFPKDKFSFYVVAGNGNNGGDGLAISRLLIENGYKVRVFVVNLKNKFSSDNTTNRKRLAEINQIYEIIDTSILPHPYENEIIIDSILGSGINKKIDGLLAQIIKQINSFDNPVISIDIPSGLYADKDSKENTIIEADITLCIGALKLALFMPENEKYCGYWELIDIGLQKEFIDNIETNYFYTDKADIKSMIGERPIFSHKGTFGHALLMCGSKGKMGAAVLAAKSCLRSGCGLTTIHTPDKLSDIIQISAPEAMVSTDNDDCIITNCPDINKFTSACFGPGCGTASQSAKALKALIQNSQTPILIDADGINILAENKTWLAFLPKRSILTPHIGEFNRLFGKYNNHIDRIKKASEEAVKNEIIIIVKGAYSTICSPNGKVYFNSTGNSGMAKGGSGDILSGLITGLLSRTKDPLFAAIAGVYLHGLTGDIAAEKYSKEAMNASDIIKCIPKAWKKIAE